MPNKLLHDLLYEQGYRCFFCQKVLTSPEASVEHLVAKANGGNDANGNCVACCRSMNALLGNKSVKEKLRVILNQEGKLQCPRSTATPPIPTKAPNKSKQTDDFQHLVANLQQRGSTCPKTVPALKNVIASACKIDVTNPKVAVLVSQLKSAGKIHVDGETVTYAL